MTDSYWLYNWLDFKNIDSEDDLRRVLLKDKNFLEITKVAEDWENHSKNLRPDGISIVAGTGLRLDDRMVCPNPSCRAQQIDILFRHAWHYFDKVLMPDGVGLLLLYYQEEIPKEELLSLLVNQIMLQNYIRKIGASSLVFYFPISTLSRYYSNEKNEDKALNSSWKGIEKRILKEFDYSFQYDSKNFKAICEFTDPYLGQSKKRSFDLSEIKNFTEDKAIRNVVRDEIGRHKSYLDEDLVIRNHFDTALGVNIWSHEAVLSKAVDQTIKTPEVAFKMKMPGLDKIPINELISLRQYEGESFLAFQNALTRAIAEQVKLHPQENTAAIANIIFSDIVQPEINKLNLKLKAAENILSKKTMVTITLSGLTTTCGLLLGVPTIAAGVAGLGALFSGSGAAASNFITETEELKVSDMYFAWKALDHAKPTPNN